MQGAQRYGVVWVPREYLSNFRQPLCPSALTAPLRLRENLFEQSNLLQPVLKARGPLPLDESAGMAQFAQDRLAFIDIEPVLGELVDAGDPVDAAEFGDVAQNIERDDFGKKISLIP